MRKNFKVRGKQVSLIIQLNTLNKETQRTLMDLNENLG